MAKAQAKAQAKTQADADVRRKAKGTGKKIYTVNRGWSSY